MIFMKFILVLLLCVPVAGFLWLILRSLVENLYHQREKMQAKRRETTEKKSPPTVAGRRRR